MNKINYEKLKHKILTNIKIDENYCWVWQKSKFKDGYGSITYNSKSYRVHRISYTIFVSVIPKGYLILHSCDNPCCCNPDHLRTGTHADNRQDMIDRDRQYQGVDVWNNKLTEKDVIEIRRLHAIGNITSKTLGEKYNVSSTYINLIVTRQRWGWL